MAAHLECVIENADPQCDFSGHCGQTNEAYALCANSLECATDRCEPFLGGCTCVGTCFDGAVAIEQECSADQDGGPDVCHCYVQGFEAGSCYTDELVCSIEAGCCQFQRV